MVAAGQDREPYVTSSPFSDLYHLAGVSTSNDEHGIAVHWAPAEYSLRFPGRPALQGRGGGRGALYAGVAVSCRTDGRSDGYSGPRPLSASLSLPLHPEEPDVYNWLHPWFWVRGLTGGEFVRTPLRVTGAGGTYATELVRATIDYSVARPSQAVPLRARGVLRALASGDGMRLEAVGAGVRLALAFDPAAAGLRGAAGLMLEHCD